MKGYPVSRQKSVKKERKKTEISHLKALELNFNQRREEGKIQVTHYH